MKLQYGAKTIPIIVGLFKVILQVEQPLKKLNKTYWPIALLGKPGKFVLALQVNALPLRLTLITTGFAAERTIEKLISD